MKPFFLFLIFALYFSMTSTCLGQMDFGPDPITPFSGTTIQADKGIENQSFPIKSVSGQKIVAVATLRKEVMG